MKQGLKDKTLPIPTFHGNYSDWRSFWRRLLEYLDRLKGLSDDEQLSFLLDAIKDTAGREIVSDAITNGDSFKEVEA